MIKTSSSRTAAGIIAAVILGLGRAVGEAIAVTQVIGNSAGIHAYLFLPADPLASRIANTIRAPGPAHVPSLAYFAVILLRAVLRKRSRGCWCAT